MAKNILFTPKAFGEYLEWRDRDDDIVERINDLILDISRDDGHYED